MTSSLRRLEETERIDYFSFWLKETSHGVRRQTRQARPDGRKWRIAKRLPGLLTFEASVSSHGRRSQPVVGLADILLSLGHVFFVQLWERGSARENVGGHRGSTDVVAPPEGGHPMVQLVHVEDWQGHVGGCVLKPDSTQVLKAHKIFIQSSSQRRTVGALAQDTTKKTLMDSTQTRLAFPFKY